MQGMSYHFAYNLLYQHYYMLNPLPVRYFWGSESFLYVVCAGFEVFRQNSGMNMQTAEFIKVIIAVVGFMFCGCVRWTTLDDEVPQQTVYSSGNPAMLNAERAQKEDKNEHSEMVNSWRNIAADKRDSEPQDPERPSERDDENPKMLMKEKENEIADRYYNDRDRSLEAEERSQYYHDLHVNFYVMTFARFAIESVPQGILFFLTITHDQAKGWGERGPHMAFFMLMVRDWVTQIMTLIYLHTVFKNNNPYW
jgi:hypothetical protein